MPKKGVVLFFLVVAIISLASADFSIGNLSHSIDKEYGPKDVLKGWINISFNSERANSKFYDSQNNSIEIMQLINKSGGFNYTCSTQGCVPDYEPSNGEEMKTFYLNKGVTKTLGFQLLGGVRSIESVEFTILNNAASSCENPIKIDVLGDEVIEITSNVSSSEICPESKNYSCFNTTGLTAEYVLGRTPYCQKMTLKEAPGFRIGAWIKKTGTKSADLAAYLYEGDTPITFCKLPDANSTGGEVYCDINFLVTNPKTYYVCVYANEGGLYNIRANQNPLTKCGFYGIPVKTSSNAYQIFAQSKKFGENHVISVKNNLPNGRLLSTIIENYISQKYGSKNCLVGCVIPVIVKSGTNQTITFKNLNLLYETTGGLVPTKTFYDLTESSSKISADFQKLFLDKGNFVLPGDYGEFEYNLNLNGEDIFTESLGIIKVPVIKGISPEVVGLGKATNFTVNVESEKNITKYIWTFGGGTINTSANKATLTLNLIGVNNITISISDTDNKTASKTFNVYVYSPEKQIDIKIDEIKSKISILRNKILTYSTFSRESIKMAVDLEGIEIRLKEIENKYANAIEGADLLQVINELDAIKLPDSIATTQKAENIIFIPIKENINLQYIEVAGGGTYDPNQEDKYLDALILWYQNNFNIKINSEEISYYGSGKEIPIVKIFELNIEGDLISKPYLIIQGLGDLSFDGNYGQAQEAGFYYIELEPGKEKITFSTTEDVDFSDLPIYMSPYLDDLDVGNGGGNGGGISKWVYFTLIIVFVIIIGFLVYLILYDWYKKRYETHLFRDRNNLFNLVNYINNEKIKGTSDNDLIKNLKKSGWSSEQITYALKKYEGKVTGMHDIPILNLFKRKNKIQVKNYNKI